MRACNGYTCVHGLKYRLDEFGGKIYKYGVKFCSVCGVFLKVVGHRCPCCKSNLRTKSHTKKWKNGGYS